MDQKTLSHKGKDLSVLISNTVIKTRVQDMAAQISKDYAGKNLLILGILNGVFVFLSDLVRELTIYDIEVDFVKLNSYKGLKSTDLVEELIGMKGEIKGRNVLVVDDILETGQTLQKLSDIIASMGAADVKFCVLIHKLGKLKVDIKVEYIGIEIEDVFIVGYGLDWDERFRGLDAIYAVKDKKREKSII